MASVWYVNIRGTLPQVIDAIRDNAAMGWSMLIMVEGFVRSEGGVGVLLINQEKHVNFAEVYALRLRSSWWASRRTTSSACSRAWRVRGR
jgi:ABC-type nitrate/sulfonate/bicarbonate transport system permease component